MLGVGALTGGGVSESGCRVLGKTLVRPRSSSKLRKHLLRPRRCVLLAQAFCNESRNPSSHVCRGQLHTHFALTSASPIAVQADSSEAKRTSQAGQHHAGSFIFITMSWFGNRPCRLNGRCANFSCSVAPTRCMCT